jgi:hypothetical protein
MRLRFGINMAVLAASTVQVRPVEDGDGVVDLFMDMPMPSLRDFEFLESPIYTEKPWLKFRTHPTNPRRPK